jgi:hypothetical protein
MLSKVFYEYLYEPAGAKKAVDTVDNLNTIRTLECTKDKYNVKIKSERVSPKVPPTTCVGQRVKGRRSERVEGIITK